MHPLNESVRFYARNIESLLLISTIIVFPFLLVYNFTMNYLNLIATITGAKIVSGIFNLFLLLLFLMVIQLPFAQYVQSEQDGEERPLLRSLRTFFEQGFSVFIFGIVYVLAVTAGMALLLLPGLIILVLLFLTPYFVVMKQRSPWRCWKAAMDMGKKHFFQIFGLLLLAGGIQSAIGLLGIYSVTFITTSYGAIFFTQLLLNLIVFPFIAVLFSMYVQKWSNEAALAEGVEEYAG